MRLMVKGALEAYGALEDENFVLARQVNFETIHNHDVLAERFGTVGELRGELANGGHSACHTELGDWLAPSELSPSTSRLLGLTCPWGRACCHEPASFPRSAAADPATQCYLGALRRDSSGGAGSGGDGFEPERPRRGVKLDAVLLAGQEAADVRPVEDDDRQRAPAVNATTGQEAPKTSAQSGSETAARIEATEA